MKQDVLFYKTFASTTGVTCSSPFLCALATTLINVHIIVTVMCSLYRANGHIVQVTTQLLHVQIMGGSITII